MPVESNAQSKGSSQQNTQLRAPDDAPRVRWRAVVHVGQRFDAARGQQPLAWHLVGCDDPARPEAHCALGRHLLATDGNPDGHCWVGGTCPRCPVPTQELARS
jgi:hypothetical protein